jgi:hypothetical protein
MDALDLVFARLANETGFADAVRNDPAAALRGLDLSLDDLRRIERLLVEPAGLTALFTTTTHDLTTTPEASPGG